MKGIARKIFGSFRLGKRLSTLFLCAALIPGLTSCGKEPEDDIPLVCVHEFLQLEGANNISLSDVRFAGDKLYYSSNSWNDQTQKSFAILHRYSFLDGGAEELALKLPEGTYLLDWNIGEDGCLYVLSAVWGLDETLGVSNNKYIVAKYDARGEEVFVTDFSELMDRDSYPNRLAVDGEGRIYAAEKYVIWFFDAEGNTAGSLKLQDVGVIGEVTSYCRGADGRVYATVKGYNKNITATGLLAVNFEEKLLEEEIPGFPLVSGLIQNPEGSFYLNEGNSVSVYNGGTQEKEKLFDWLDCDVNGGDVTGFGTLSDGRMVAAFEDWNVGDKGIIVIDRVRADQVTMKQEVVLGTLTGFDSSYVVYFNRRSNDYRISIRQYLEDYDRVEDALNRLNADIVSDNCPDLLYLNFYYMEVHQMASNGAFEDLAPFLERSGLDRSDMFESLLEDNTYNGKLICIPSTFGISTVIGSTDVVGEEMGWTAEDAIALAEAYPEAGLFDWTYREKLLWFLLDVNSYVDWETGTCGFDSDEFKSLLEYVSLYPGYEEMTFGNSKGLEEQLQSGEALLYEHGFIDCLDQIQVYKEMFGGDVTCIGYPNARGSSGASFSTFDHYVIMARSKRKEGAWAFIESYLTKGYQTRIHGWGFPNSKSELELMVQDALNMEYVLDENGERKLDELGFPIVVRKENANSTGNGTRFDRVPTKEDIDMIYALIQSAGGGTSDADYRTRVIIDEEVDAYFLGQKSVDEVADIIQSRMKVYVSENS